MTAEAKDDASNKAKLESKGVYGLNESASTATPPLLPPRLPPRDSGERPSEVRSSEVRSSVAQPAEAKSSEPLYLEDKPLRMQPVAPAPREVLREVQSVNSVPHSMAPGKPENGSKTNAGVYRNLPAHTSTALPYYRGKEDSDDEEPAVQMLATSVAPKPEVQFRREGFATEAPFSCSAIAKPQNRQGAELSAKGTDSEAVANPEEVARSKPRRPIRMADGLVVEEQAGPATNEAKKGEVFSGDSSSEEEDVLAAEKKRLKRKQALAQAKQGPLSVVRLANACMNRKAFVQGFMLSHRCFLWCPGIEDLGGYSGGRSRLLRLGLRRKGTLSALSMLRRQN